MGLQTYRSKRRFSKTSEPRGAARRSPGNHFVVQKHAARALHFDFRLEFGGVLKSWAVPKGPPIRPNERHLAVMVEDHPLEYRTFEGRIPKGEYGAGTVKIWDEGTYEPLGNFKKGLAEGKIEVRLQGKKLKGDYVLVRMDGRIKNGWLFMKMKQEKLLPLIEERLSLPTKIEPMLAVLAEKSFEGPEWIFEPKWDGYRVMATVQKRKTKLVTRNGLSYTDKIPQIAQELSRLPVSCVLDGEVVALDERGRQSFQHLQEYFKDRKAKLVYEVFDLVYLDGHDIRNLPLVERKKLLKRLVQGMKHVSYTEHVAGRGSGLLKQAQKTGAKGIMAKASNGAYPARHARYARKKS